MAVLVAFLLHLVIQRSLGSPAIPSPYIQPTHPDEIRQNYFRDYGNQQPQRSYIIYEGDLNSVPGNQDRPQTSSTRSWHLEFNQRRQSQPMRPSTPIAYSSVFSNLIQVYDRPPNKYLGEYESKNYREPFRDIYNYQIPPIQNDVPKYEVIYPYQSDRQTYYYPDKLPNNFPTPFSPNKNFQFKEPTITSDIRKDYGFYHTQTISYPTNDEKRRDNCNYIKLNEKGYPIGNEMCGRSISDIILAPDYPTTGQLMLEHRKRYRGTNQDSGFETNKVSVFNRKKRNAERFREFNSYFPNSECCGKNKGGGYGYQPQFRQEFGYGDNRFMSRPYGEEGNIAVGYGYRGQGQNYNNNEDDVGEETSDNQGLTSYLTNRGRGNHGQFKENGDNYGDSDEENDSRTYYNRGGSRQGNTENKNNNNSNGNQGNSRKSNNNSRNYRRNENSNRSSNNNGGSSETASQGNNRSVNNQRNFEDSYNNSGAFNNRNGGNSFGYFRNDEGDRNYGSNMDYDNSGRGFRTMSTNGFRGDSNMDRNNFWRNSSPYGNSGYSAYNNRFTR